MSALRVTARPLIRRVVRYGRQDFRACKSTLPKSVAEYLSWKPTEPTAGVHVDGYVRSVRAQKRQHFVSLGDGTTIDSLQAVVPADQAEGLTTGAAVRLHGSWVPSRGQGQSHELQVQSADILGASDAKTFPLQKKYQSPEYLRTMPHMRPRLPYNSTLFRFRSEVIASLTRFFEGRQFIQTHTPILTASDCEGAGEVFNVANIGEKPQSNSEKNKSFFRRPVYTTVSGQLHLEALAQGLGNVWTLSPTFRAEQSDTPRHLSEFYMLEAEMSFTNDMASVMGLIEDMLRHIASELIGSRTVKELSTRTAEGLSDLAPVDQVERRWQGLMKAAWPRITYTDAIDILNASDEQFEIPPVWGQDLRTEHERYLAVHIGQGETPVFVTNYPRTIKAFYMKASEGDLGTPGHGETVECFDLLVPDFCEIAGGSMREHRLDNLMDSMKLHGMDTASEQVIANDGKERRMQNNLDWYIDLRRWGCPPHGGFGLGFDRLICYLSGVQTIRDTTAFPRWYGRCDC
ncbi:hypothetical protein BKA67DRAFT_516712 [Truncatella angustata]|uniref:asparagine--tRNA ligase n=1 Tax=Truncatella angustata TaxID=152316 RepID=A0A9P8UMI9_9PEZI|nr:uncharacterized protein BKA67DRAFT_516712 [Truncatella angustata]KAH6654675.1 hypothetical protein BKA67DRAFT_516712 [Truncatella angustata]KAH8196943.1 hypothetical protein TruAng_008900 [Truncatella angustata]